MTSPMQLEMFAQGVTQAHVDELLRLLRVNGWLTRRQLGPLTGWAERSIRSVAEQAGTEVVRGPRGFNVVERCSLDEIEHCAAIAESQGKKMVEYALALRRRAHARLA